MNRKLPISMMTNCKACNVLRESLLRRRMPVSATAHFKLCDRCEMRKRRIEMEIKQ